MPLSDLPDQSRAAGRTLQDYLEGHLSYAKLLGTEKLAQLTAWLLSRFVFVVILALTLIFLSTGLAYWLGSLLGATHLGFFLVGGGFVLVLLIALLAQKSLLTRPIMDSVVRLMYQDEPLEDFLHPTDNPQPDEADAIPAQKDSQHA